jgi:hypothetical protein
VHTFNFVKERLGQLVNACGGEESFQNNYAVNVDRDVLQAFQRLGTHENVEQGTFWADGNTL